MLPQKISVAQALSQLPSASTAKYPQGAPFVQMLRHGSMSVELYRPQCQDLQTPHEQDELYVVVAGQGAFFCGGETRDFGPGDCLFVPAGVEHRFTRFNDNFVTWVIFYGPPGGETNLPASNMNTP
jgi:mannose-6-phosphate isomerase-like protein (cupin superfamily)